MQKEQAATAQRQNASGGKAKFSYKEVGLARVKRVRMQRSLSAEEGVSKSH